MRPDPGISTPSPQEVSPVGRWSEVLWAFLRLGLTAFGGPVAHLGYFRQAFVVRRGWLSEAAFADLVALCQFLPGPASSQVGFAIGLTRAGLPGALAAWIGFTLPSALMMTALGLGAGALSGGLALGLVHGLKLVAVVVVAQAVAGMARSQAPDPARAAIAILALALGAAAPAGWLQIAGIALGAVLGLMLCRDGPAASTEGLAPGLSRRAGLIAAVLFGLLLIRPGWMGGGHGLAVFSAFYRSGALVFGGGHVVLPLLREAVVTPGWVRPDVFLAGYGAAQAAPGPLFTFAAYLGAALQAPPNGLAGAALALAALFLPGLLILMAALPFWSRLRRLVWAQAAMRGANAAVVGILALALYDPVWSSAVGSRADFAAVAAGLVLLTLFRAPPLLIVLLGAGFGLAGAA